ncbi:hypothetical protein ACHQM5_014448 [Ranunculus cassubicifolius]
MSEDESDYLSDSEENEAPSRGEKVKKVIQFSDIGHPIGPGSIQYASFVGQVARAHCRPTFVDWKVVPDTVKEHIWDNDPVAIVCKPDGNGRVCGVGSGISKTVINASAPYREVADREKRKREITEANFSIVMHRLDEETKARKIMEEKLAHLFESSTSNSAFQERRRSPTLDDESNTIPASTRLLKSFTKKNIALGNIRTYVTPIEGLYEI